MFGRRFANFARNARSFSAKREIHTERNRTIQRSLWIAGALAAVPVISWGVSSLFDNFVVGATAHADSDHIDGPEKWAESKLPVEFCEKVQKILGDRFVFRDDDRGTHSRDFSYHDPVLPEAVLYIHDVKEVVEVIKLCNCYKVPVIPFGSGTSLEGHVIPEVTGSISLNLRGLNKVIDLHLDDMNITIQPGLTFTELNSYLAKDGLMFPLDPGPGASIGGMINTSCSGTNAVRFGTAKDQVLSLKVVTPDGRIVKTRSRAKKSSAGYDLTHLFIGSEGTLGVVVEATLKLQKIPAYSTVATCTFNSVKDAAEAVVDMVQRSVRIGKVELLDDACLKAVNLNNYTNFTEKPTLIFEFAGSKLEVEDQIRQTEDITSRHSALQFKYATNIEERDELWQARKEALWSAPALQEGASVLITDACVPISRLAECLLETQNDIKESGLHAPIVAHAGDGNFHLFVLFDKENADQVHRAEVLNDKLVMRAIDMDGTCTGEHGVGVGKRKYIPRELGDNAVHLMATIKQAIDPNNIMNPNKIFFLPGSLSSTNHSDGVAGLVMHGVKKGDTCCN